RGGVVATASYEARKYGVRSAMSSKRARELCRHLIFIRPRFDVYRQVSEKIREIFSRYTDLIEPLSLDEAYLDVTVDKQNIGSAIDIAKEIRESIKQELQLTASAGVSINKFVAKIASDLNKPDGLTFIGPSRIESFMESLPVEKFHGVGKVTAEKMRSMGLFTGADLKKLSEADLERSFGKSGRFFYKIVRGIDDREVQPHRETKSVGAEDTFATDLTTIEELRDELMKLAALVQKRLEKHQLKGRTITLKIKFHNFKVITRSQSLPTPTADTETIFNVAAQLMSVALDDSDKIRLLGISVSNFGELLTVVPESGAIGQLKLF
ncbi:MAG TPA: DNA polymerase IV, partial [Sphingobacteriaceae bacterium]